MKRHMMTKGGLLAGLGAVALMAGCSTNQPYVNYAEKGLYSGASAGNQPFVEVGPVTAKQRGYVWDSCDDLVEQVTTDLLAKAGEVGANRIVDLEWVNHAQGERSSQPICTTGYGWFAAFGVGGLGNWVRTAEARGTLVFAEHGPLDALQGAVAQQAAEHERRLQEQAAEKARLEALAQQQAAEAKQAEADAKARAKAEKAEAKERARAEKNAETETN